jgi:adenylyl-sulfate kinase
MSANTPSSPPTAPQCVWLTGLPSAGKSSTAQALAASLAADGIRHVVLDADALRQTLNADLGFSRADRTENVRRIAQVARLFLGNGSVAIVAAITPYRDDRALVRGILQPFNMLEVFVSAPVQVCMDRDVKGLYARARAGAVKDLVGVDIDYEPPEQPDVLLHTDRSRLDESVVRLRQVLAQRA